MVMVQQSCCKQNSQVKSVYSLAERTWKETPATQSWVTVIWLEVGLCVESLSAMQAACPCWIGMNARQCADRECGRNKTPWSQTVQLLFLCQGSLKWNCFVVRCFVVTQCLSCVWQVLVSHIESVCCYWGRVLDHRYDDGAAGQSVQSQFVALSLRLSQWFSKASNRRRMNSPKTGMRCAVQLGDGVFHR